MTRIFSARVQNGVIVAQDLELPEGAEVTVCLEDDQSFTVSAAQEEELLAAIDQADRGLGIPAAETLAVFRRR